MARPESGGLFNDMNFILLILAGVAAIFLLKKSSPATGARGASNTVASTGTATTPAAWLPGWNGFTQTQQQNLGAATNSAFSNLAGLSNNFGENDGGTNPGVSVGGSASGGVQSSGSGAGLPVADSSPDLGDQVTVADQSTAAPLNGYDDSDYSDFGDSSDV